jgi:hypothetical protein
LRFLAATLEGGSFGANAGGSGVRYAGGGIGILVIPVLLMLLFRKKYPRWWYDWNLQLTRFSNRIAVYFALMDDRYPSTDEEQAVHVNFPYPNQSAPGQRRDEHTPIGSEEIDAPDNPRHRARRRGPR